MSPRDAARDALQSFRDSPWTWLLVGVVMAAVWVTRVESTQRYHTDQIARLDSLKVDRRDLHNSIEDVMHELGLLRASHDTVAVRLREIICEDKPRFCR
jgi:hypothetical protein